MRRNFLRLALLSTAIGIAATGVARADCESALIQLEQALKAPNLTATGKAALDDATTKALAAMKKDDDAGCHKAVGDGMTKAGMTLQ
jgi:hypothetical protein